MNPCTLPPVAETNDKEDDENARKGEVVDEPLEILVQAAKLLAEGHKNKKEADHINFRAISSVNEFMKAIAGASMKPQEAFQWACKILKAKGWRYLDDDEGFDF